MKKFLLLVFLLFASLFCTACINNLAIQELNQIGKEYLEKGDFDAAISRFQSCLDLDENIFETRYNLGVAYIAKQEYTSAIENLKRAVELNPASPDAYYSLAVALEDEGFKFREAESPNEQEIAAGLDLAREALKMYEKYTVLLEKPDEAVGIHIEELKQDIEKYNTLGGETSDDINPARE